ncbi:unnamed protein product [Amoebophrya sp. A25]|nr:unnamed protein product [Amoebophrya sp. A25]|eukprot:GSA25T00008740001.1
MNADAEENLVKKLMNKIITDRKMDAEKASQLLPKLKQLCENQAGSATCKKIDELLEGIEWLLTESNWNLLKTLRAKIFREKAKSAANASDK